MVALAGGKPQGHNQQLFQAARGPGYGGDPSLAKIIEEQRFNLGNGGKFGHAAHQVINVAFHSDVISFAQLTINYINYLPFLFGFYSRRMV